MYISRSTISMSPIRILRTVFILLASFGTLTCADELSRVSNSVCPVKSIQDSILGFKDSVCQLSGIEYSLGVIEVILHTHIYIHTLMIMCNSCCSSLYRLYVCVFCMN